MTTVLDLTSSPKLDRDSNQVKDFAGRLRGPLLLPEDAGYDDSRSVWNGMIQRRPTLVVRCLGVADVVAGVNFARDNGMLLSVKGGGHNIAGLAVGEGGLLLDMSLMRGVWVDPQNRTARAQAGCLLGDVDRETQLYGLAAVLGFVSNTGIAGLTLGGGFGYLTRRFGWTSDTVLSMEVVTADGKIVRASESENPDLFWGLRGGGGNLGIVTSFEYRLHEVGPEIVGGLIAWPAEDAETVLEMYRATQEKGSAELTSALVMRMAPPAPWLPKEIHGKPIIAMVMCHSGSIDAAEREVARIKGFGSPVGDIVQRRPYVSQQNILDATQPKGRRYYWKSEYVSELSADLLETGLAHAARILSPHSAVIVFPIGGALNRLPEDNGSVGNRDARFVLNITGAWDSTDDDASNVAWARETWQDMRRFSTGGTYINFLTEDESDERIRSAYRSNYDRMVEVKTRWDPENLFRVNKNIAPR